MPLLEAQAGKLLIYDPEKSRTTPNVYIFRGSPLEEKNLGKLFVLMEIESPDNINHEIIRAIQEEIRVNYYQSTEFDNLEVAFENTLQKVNQKLPDLLAPLAEGDKDWLDKISILIAILRNNILHFASVGKTEAFLIHKDKIVNILESTSSPESGEINPLKIFSNIISGNLNPQDALLFCTPTLLEYISLEKLKHIIASHPSSEATLRLEDLLAENEGYHSFAAIVVKLIPVEEAWRAPERTEATLPQASAPQSSMEELITREQTTSRLLTPSLGRVVFKESKALWQRLKLFIQLKVLKQSSRRAAFMEKERTPGIVTPSRERQKRSLITRFLAFLILSVKNGLQKIVWLIRKIIISLKSKEALKGQIQTFPKRTEKGITKKIIRFKYLPRSRKVLLIVALILIFLFAESIVWLGDRREKARQAQEYDQILAQAQESVAEAEAAMIYENEEDARLLLIESSNLLAKIPADSKKYKEEISNLNQKIQAQSNIVNHINNIPEPITAADFTTVDFSANLAKITGYQDNIYAFNPTNNSIYQANLTDQNVSLVSDKPSLESKLKFIFLKDQNNLLFYLENDSLQELNLKENNFTPRTIAYANQDRTIKDIFYYSNRFYTLDPKNNQIFRHSRSGLNWGQGESWIQAENLDVKDGVSLAINGSIYVLKSNGEIYKLFGGALDEDFKPSTFEPNLSGATKISTETELTNLYILDPPHKRLILLTKEGKLINQYVSDKFDNLKDLYVREKDKKVYLLNGTKILEVEVSF